MNISFNFINRALIRKQFHFSKSFLIDDGLVKTSLDYFIYIMDFGFKLNPQNSIILQKQKSLLFR